MWASFEEDLQLTVTNIIVSWDGDILFFPPLAGVY